ncbi:MAG: CapA family protein [Ruminiclostridium sp.]|nr:CapA family protein [Ruminiclostridium sp.]
MLLFAILIIGLYYFYEFNRNDSKAVTAATTVKAESSVAVTPIPAPTPTPTPKATEPPVLKLMAVGDIMLGRSVGKRLEKTKDGYDTAFSDVSGLLNHGDIVFANIEAPITESLHSLNKEKNIILKSSPISIDALESAGFNLFSLANNHMLDYYDTGLFDTMNLLDNNGLKYSGAGKNLEDARKPAIIEKNGIRIGLLSYTDMAQYIFAGNPSISFAAETGKAGVAPRIYEYISEDISKLREQVDLVAISLHWGVEESFTVTPEQVEFAHKLLDEGADMILGHHPHQFQGIEIYKGKPILYSMGNFIFDQNDPENMETFIVEMNYEGIKLKSLEAVPVRILDKSRAVVQKEEEAAKMLEREILLSNKLETACSVQNGRLVFKLY